MRPCKKCGVLFEGHHCKSCAKVAVKRWQSANPEKANAATTRWKNANKEKVSKWNARWEEKNPEARRALHQNRRARKRNSGGRLSPGLITKLFKLQRGKCPCCGKPLGDNYHLDHRMPLVLGGANEDWNMQLLRQRCNNEKHAKHPVEFMQLRGFLL